MNLKLKVPKDVSRPKSLIQWSQYHFWVNMLKKKKLKIKIIHTGVIDKMVNLKVVISDICIYANVL